MRTFNLDRRPHYPDWGEPIKTYFGAYREVFAILNPFVKVPAHYDPSRAEHSLWGGKHDIDYPGHAFVCSECEEVTWAQVIQQTTFSSISEINHALINNGLGLHLRDEEKAQSLFEFCDQHGIYGPLDACCSPFNLLKIKQLLNHYDQGQLEVLSESGDQDQTVALDSLDASFTDHTAQATLITLDRQWVLSNHWDSYITAMATNYPCSVELLESFGFEVVYPDENFTLDIR